MLINVKYINIPAGEINSDMGETSLQHNVNTNLLSTHTWDSNQRKQASIAVSRAFRDTIVICKPIAVPIFRGKPPVRLLNQNNVRSRLLRDLVKPQQKFR